MKIYGIRNKITKVPLRQDAYVADYGSNKICCTVFSLIANSIYMVDDIEIAKTALEQNQGNNFSLNFPKFPANYNPNKFEVFEINIETK